MPKENSRSILDRIQAEHGYSLLEVLVAVALTAMVSTTVISVLVPLLKGRQSLQAQTDTHQSVRIPAIFIMHDARGATGCDATTSRGDYWENYLRFTTPSAEITYRFSVDDEDAWPYGSMHRIQVDNGGGSTRDDIVGWQMVVPDPELDVWGVPRTKFACPSDTQPLRLVTAPPKDESEGIELDVNAVMRPLR